MKKLFSLIILMLAMADAHAQIPANTRIQPVMVSTNSGVVLFGTNSYSVVSVTNAFAFSNTVSIVGAATFKGAMIISNVVSSVSTNVALAAITNNDFSVAGTTFIVVTNAAENIVFSGFTAGRDGQPLTIFNYTGTNMYFYQGSSLSTAGNRLFFLGSQTTLTNTGLSCVDFIYSTTGTNWVLRTYNP